MGNSKELTKHERKFAEEYVSNGYKAVAAYMVGYPNAKESTAKTDAWIVLKRPRVKEYIADLQKDGFERLCINAERIAAELAEIAFADKQDDTYTVNFKLKAIELLQKQLGLQTTKVDTNITTPVTIAIKGMEEENEND